MRVQFALQEGVPRRQTVAAQLQDARVPVEVLQHRDRGRFVPGAGPVEHGGGAEGAVEGFVLGVDAADPEPAAAEIFAHAVENVQVVGVDVRGGVEREHGFERGAAGPGLGVDGPGVDFVDEEMERVFLAELHQGY